VGGGGVATTDGNAPSRAGLFPAPPAAGLMAVVLLEQLVHAGDDRADDAELGQVRAEPRPEPVVGARLVDGARVHRQPVPDEPPVENPEGDARRRGTYQAGRDDGTPLHPCSPPAPSRA